MFDIAFSMCYDNRNIKSWKSNTKEINYDKKTILLTVLILCSAFTTVLAKRIMVKLEPGIEQIEIQVTIRSQDATIDKLKTTDSDTVNMRVKEESNNGYLRIHMSRVYPHRGEVLVDRTIFPVMLNKEGNYEFKNVTIDLKHIKEKEAWDKDDAIIVFLEYYDDVKHRYLSVRGFDTSKITLQFATMEKYYVLKCDDEEYDLFTPSNNRLILKKRDYISKTSHIKIHDKALETYKDASCIVD